MKPPGGNLRRTGMPPREVPLSRSSRLEPGTPPARTARLGRNVQLRAVSANRARENRQRRQMVESLYPERPQCGRPACPRMADDLHEPLTRARGGSITDPDNQVPLCRPCHDEITFRPESELQWAYDCGLLVHRWDAPKDGAA